MCSSDLVKTIGARTAVNLDVVLKQLNALRGQGGGVTPAATAPVAAEVTRRSAPTAAPGASQVVAPNPSPQVGNHAAPATPASVTSGTPVPSENLEALWAQLVEAAGRASPFVRTYLLEAHPVSFAKSVFTIGFDPEFADHLGLVDNPRNHTLLQTKLAELGHANTQIKFMQAEAPADRVAPAAEAPPVASPPLPKSAPPATPKVSGSADRKSVV